LWHIEEPPVIPILFLISNLEFILGTAEASLSCCISKRSYVQVLVPNNIDKVNNGAEMIGQHNIPHLLKQEILFHQQV
jgi:hypothetical protein